MTEPWTTHTPRDSLTVDDLRRQVQQLCAEAAGIIWTENLVESLVIRAREHMAKMEQSTHLVVPETHRLLGRLVAYRLGLDMIATPWLERRLDQWYVLDGTLPGWPAFRVADGTPWLERSFRESEGRRG